jgi:hypothetical protein
MPGDRLSLRRAYSGVLFILLGLFVGGISSTLFSGSKLLLGVSVVAGGVVAVLVSQLHLFAEQREEEQSSHAQKWEVALVVASAIAGTAALVFLSDEVFFFAGFVAAVGLIALGVKMVNRGRRAGSSENTETF